MGDDDDDGEDATLGVSAADVVKFYAFLRLVDGSAGLRTTAGLLSALRRYLECWLPILASSGPEVERLALPTDVAFIWYVHMLCPQEYFRDLTLRGSRFPEHGAASPVTAAIRPRGGEAWLRTALVWESKYPNEPFDVLGSSGHLTFSTDSLDLRAEIPETSLSSALEARARLQRAYFYQVSLPHYQNPDFLQRAVSRYEKFLSLYADKPSHTLYPPYDVDMVWRTHIATGLRYVRDTVRRTGHMVAYEDAQLAMASGDFLQSQLAPTARLYRDAFSESLYCSGTLARGSRPELAQPRGRWSGRLHLEAAKLQELAGVEPGQGQRPTLCVSGSPGGAKSVRRQLDGPSAEGWTLPQRLTVAVDGRSGAELYVELLLSAGRRGSLAACTVPEMALSCRMRLDDTAVGTVSRKLELQSTEGGSDRITLRVKFHVVERRPCKGALTVSLKVPSADQLAVCSAGGSIEPFNPPKRLDRPVCRTIDLTGEGAVPMGKLDVEHYFDGLALQRRYARVQVSDDSGAVTCCARLVGRQQLVEDPAMVWGLDELTAAPSGKGTLSFLLTVGRRDWGIVQGRWEGLILGSGASASEPGALHMKVSRLLDRADNVANTFNAVVQLGKAAWLLFDDGRGTDDDAVVAHPDDSSVRVGCELEPEVGVLLTACASLLSLFLCPPLAVAAVSKRSSLGGLYGVGGMRVGGLIGSHLAETRPDAVYVSSLMESVRDHFERTGSLR